MLGIEEYKCIDLGGGHGAIVHDLNFPLDKPELYERFDYVTDHGNNEHPFNVAETYRTMHNLCKVNGLMMIVQMVYKGNGYYRFDSSFFEGLAAANKYEVLFSSYIITPKTLTPHGSNNEFHIPLSEELLDTIDWSKVASIGICYVFKKKISAVFEYPYEGSFLSQQQKNIGFQLQFLPSPSYTYVPVISEKNLSMSALHIGKLLLDRVFRKIRFK
jgi:hypothetical protein